MPLKLGEIQDMTSSELNEQLKKSYLSLSELRMKFASRQLEDSSQIKKTRQEIARILTTLTQKMKEELPLEKSERITPDIKKEKKAKQKIKQEPKADSVKKKVTAEDKKPKEVAKKDKEGKIKRKK